MSSASASVAEMDGASLVAEALEACESAEALWQEGDLDGSLATLDLAYQLMLEIPDDPSLIQQKDDLRHLISHRVLEIYRSRSTAASDLNSPIPVEINEYVQREIARFTGRERNFFIESYRRSGRYRPMIVRKLREAGLPEELSWLPLVESGFKDRALSRARALGIWQFISSTGSRYGLARSHWIDERMDPEKSTDAAIQYLTDLHGMFGDWMMALAGYNCGENRVKSLIRRQEYGHLDRFWDLFGGLPSETARYVPRFLATLAIVQDPAAYGLELPQPNPAVDFETVTVGRHLRLDDLDRALELERNALVGLNPELRRGTTPGETYTLRVPSAVAGSFETKVAALPAYVPPPEVTYARYRIRRGDTLSTIARRYRTSVSAIMRANHLRSAHRIRIGQHLKIPRRGASPPAVSAGRSDGSPLMHTVRRGDSLWKLASHYGSTVDRIKRDNGLPGNDLSIGQKLQIRKGGATGARSYTVRRGDTIGRIAQAQNISIDRLLRTNGLSRSSTIYPGQVIQLPN
ncbi:MAG: LysM peptidoglycan-binding domain-containing protein [Deltaproteobacteria bacterium]|nr:LysM peptidoglycan-binding domain-containing protein [Deltaproteobacteria bacterium]